MKTKAIAVILCSLMASGAGAAEDVKDMGIFMDEDQGDGYVWGNKSYTGPKEVVALKVFSDGMDDFLEWMEIYKK